MDDVCIQEEVQITIPCKLKIVSLLATIRCQKTFQSSAKKVVQFRTGLILHQF